MFYRWKRGEPKRPDLLHLNKDGIEEVMSIVKATLAGW